MKRTMILAMALLLILALAGCACEHEWSEADCVNAAVCAKCEEVGEAALGHDWSDATCTAPQTCGRCGETQGEALGHDFGEWVYTKTEKSRTCTRCNHTESEEIDEKTYAQYLMNGQWDCYLIVANGQQYTSYNLKEGVMPQYVNFDGDSVQFNNATDVFDLTLEYQEYNEEIGAYAFLGSFDDGSQVPIWLYEGEAENLIYLFFDQENFTIFSQYKNERAVAIATWACSDNGNVYSIQMMEDGTFTADWGEEVSGTWQMMPTTTSYSSHMGGCKLGYEKDGQLVVLDGSFYYSYGETVDWESAMYGATLTVTPSKELGSLSFDRMQEPEDLDALKAAVAEGGKVVLGTWNSKTLTIYSDGSDTTEIIPDYAITLNEDGTFTLKTDEELTGTWAFNSATANYGQTTYMFDAELDNSKDHVSMYLSSDNNLYFSIYQNNKNYRYSFAHLTEEQKADLLKGPQLAIGEYVSTSVRYQGSSEEVAETGFTMTINEDGTYVANVGQSITGVWSFDDISERGFDYRFTPDVPEDSSETATTWINSLTKDGMLDFTIKADGSYTHVQFQKQ